MFFAIFWTAYIPIGMLLCYVIGERLLRSLRQLRVRAGLAASNRRRSKGLLRNRPLYNSQKRSLAITMRATSIRGQLQLFEAPPIFRRRLAGDPVESGAEGAGGGKT
jgi:hypothetical protein